MVQGARSRLPDAHERRLACLPRCIGLTIHSSRTGFASRLNSGVRPCTSIAAGVVKGDNLRNSASKNALLLVLGVVAVSFVLASGAKVARSARAASSTAEEALAIGEEASGRIEALEGSTSGDLEDRISSLESQTSDLEDQDREHSLRIDEVESEVRNQALMRSW